MVRKKLPEHIKKLKSKLLQPVQKVRHLTYRPFLKSVQDVCRRNSKMFKLLLPVMAAGILNFSPARAATPTIPNSAADKQITIKPVEIKRQEAVANRVNHAVSQLQADILKNMNDLQTSIRAAKQNGQRELAVKEILDAVYPRSGLPGSSNYCVAGAMLALRLCQNDELNDILADPNKRPKDYGFYSHPNVSCPYMRQFFKQTLGKNYAERGDKNFKEFVQTLEAGDIITIRSSANTSSGEHCVICAGSAKDGKISIKSLNNERDYEVALTRIVGAAKIIEQYRQDITLDLDRKIVAGVDSVTNTLHIDPEPRQTGSLKGLPQLIAKAENSSRSS